MKKNNLAQVDLEALSGIDGGLIRRFRHHRNMTVRELAEKAAISKTTLLRIEAGEPTRVQSLAAVCRALQLMPDQVKRPPEGRETGVDAHLSLSEDNPFRIGYLTPKAPRSLRVLTKVDDANERQRMAQLGFIGGFYRMIPNHMENGKLFSMVLEPKSGPCGLLVGHPGEEFVYCMQGPARVHIEDKTIELNTGDSLYFRSEQGHRYSVGESYDPNFPPTLLLVWTEEPGVDRAVDE